MRRKGFGVLVPALTACTLVGTAFSTWYFEDLLSKNANQNVGITVSEYAQVGEITVSGGNSLTLDQTSTNLNEAITFTYTKPEGGVDTGVKFKLTITIPTELNSFIKVNETVVEGITARENVYTLDNVSLTGGNTYVLPEGLFTWQADDDSHTGKPVNKTEYDQLVTAARENITVNLTGTIDNPNK